MGDQAQAAASVRAVLTESRTPAGAREGWKPRLVETLIALKLIEPRFTGSLTIHLNDGGVSVVQKVISVR